MTTLEITGEFALSSDLNIVLGLVGEVGVGDLLIMVMFRIIHCDGGGALRKLR